MKCGAERYFTLNAPLPLFRQPRQIVQSFAFSATFFCISRQFARFLGRAFPTDIPITICFSAFIFDIRRLGFLAATACANCAINAIIRDDQCKAIPAHRCASARGKFDEERDSLEFQSGGYRARGASELGWRLMAMAAMNAGAWRGGAPIAIVKRTPSAIRSAFDGFELDKGMPPSIVSRHRSKARSGQSAERRTLEIEGRANLVAACTISASMKSVSRI